MIKKILTFSFVVQFLLISCSNAPVVSSEKTKTENTQATSTSIPTPTQKIQKTKPKTTHCLPRYGELNEFLHLNPTSDLWGVHAADFNDDGFPDIVLTRGIFQSGETTGIEFLINDGEGSFTVETENILSGDNAVIMEPREVLLADFNGDGRMDIFIADQGMDTDPFPGHQNTLVLSAAGGTMIDATENLPQQSDQTHSATSADIDNDGDLDLFIGNLGGGGVPPQFWLNDGNGKFTIAEDLVPHGYFNDPPNWYTTSLFADINNDSFPDLILGQGNPKRDSHVLINDGSGHFTEVDTPLPPSPSAPIQNPLDIAAADINNDGYLDLFVSDTKNTYVGGGHIQVLINNKDNTFHDETSTRMPDLSKFASWIPTIKLIDLNMDGYLDLGISQFEGGPIFFLNNGEGIFKQLSDDFKIEDTTLWTFLDINQDGFLDVFWSYTRSPEIHFTVMALGCP